MPDGGTSDIADLPFIAFSRASAPGLLARIQELFYLNDFRPKTAFEGGQLETVRRMVLSGLGWAIVPSFAPSPPDGNGSLVTMEISGLTRRIEIGPAWRKGRENRNTDSLLAVGKEVLATRWA